MLDEREMKALEMENTGLPAERRMVVKRRADPVCRLNVYRDSFGLSHRSEPDPDLVEIYETSPVR